MTTTWQRLQQANVPFRGMRAQSRHNGFDRLVSDTLSHEDARGKLSIYTPEYQHRRGLHHATWLAVSLVRADYLELARLRKENQA